MGRQHVFTEGMIGILAELVCDQSIRAFKLQELQAAIDKALESRDEQTFHQLVDELKLLS